MLNFLNKVTPEVETLRLMGAMLEEFSVDLAGGSADDSRLERQFKKVAGLRGRFSVPAGRNLALAHAARHLVLLMETLRREMKLFGVSSDTAVRRMAGCLSRIGRFLRTFEGGTSASRTVWEDGRRGLRELRDSHEAAMKDLMNRRDAVDVMKRREAYFQLLRIGETIGRVFRLLEFE